MMIVRDIPKLKSLLRAARAQDKTVGFVPTMGAFHDGHLSLMRVCRRENDLVVVSIFVNPIQFGPKEDFRRYPRQEKKDVFLAKKENVDIIFCPSIKNMYPDGYLTSVEVADVSNRLCGRSRPGHFRGVATVVAKLLNIVEPDRLYLGEKDAQQGVVIQRMIEDLNVPVSVRILKTVRETDGLAMSSRNQYLTAVQRREAAVLYRALKSAADQIRHGERRAQRIRQTIRRMILRESSARIDYVACVDGNSLRPVDLLQGRVLVALAVWFGNTRLIDNITINII